MKKIKIVAGTVWALLCLILMLAFFPAYNTLSGSFAGLPFMKINPNYSGGEIAHESIQANCTIVIRKPVFDGLFKERKDGFVQIDWRGEIPAEIIDTIDFDLDNTPDFGIRIDTKTSDTQIDPINAAVNGLDISTPTSYGWAARIKLEKQED
jgi:hypothetical protein